MNSFLITGVVIIVMILFILADWLRSQLDKIKNDLKQMEDRIMSKQSDVAGIATDANNKLTTVLTGLNAIDEKVKALVAASNNPDADLDPATQSALDALVATVNSVSSETSTLGTDAGTAAPSAPTA